MKKLKPINTDEVVKFLLENNYFTETFRPLAKKEDIVYRLGQTGFDSKYLEQALETGIKQGRIVTQNQFGYYGLYLTFGLPKDLSKKDKI